MDLDTTIGYDEAEQDVEAISMQVEPVESLMEIPGSLA